MARAFADAYRSMPWTAVYVSPMKRTIATAKPLCDALGLEMQLREGLKEIRYGKWEDKSVNFVKQHYPDDYIRWLAEPAWNPPFDVHGPLLEVLGNRVYMGEELCARPGA